MLALYYLTTIIYLFDYAVVSRALDGLFGYSRKVEDSSRQYYHGWIECIEDSTYWHSQRVPRISNNRLEMLMLILSISVIIIVIAIVVVVIITIR